VSAEEVIVVVSCNVRDVDIACSSVVRYPDMATAAESVAALVIAARDGVEVSVLSAEDCCDVSAWWTMPVTHETRAICADWIRRDRAARRQTEVQS
jgi:hypothetical protein